MKNENERLQVFICLYGDRSVSPATVNSKELSRSLSTAVEIGLVANSVFIEGGIWGF